MAWRETNVFEERNRFITGYHCYGWTMTELCKAFGVSRKTGYKILNRYQQEGICGLYDRSSLPQHRPNATKQHIVDLLIDAKGRHPTWGPNKLVPWLKKHYPGECFPAISTAGDILKRHGLVKPRRLRRRCAPASQPFRSAGEPNDVWCGDFKGWFRVKNGKKCEPFTLTDACTRYLLECQAVSNTQMQTVKRQFEIAFREYGLPQAIRTDNGPPFASVGIAGLSRLSVWWLKLGIIPERIEPGRPEQNGRHERMHLTLKIDTAIPPKASLKKQQEAFDDFKKEYNEERPHEALDNQTPSDRYQPSERRFPRRLNEFEYPKHFETRRVRENGDIKWKGGRLFLSGALQNERVGLEQTEEDHWTVHLGPLEIAIVSESHRRVLPYRGLIIAEKRES
jgi:transposase InsO family protein